MATVSHTIYSRYDPFDRETLERETGQLDEVDPNDAWESDAYLGSQRRRAPPPHFIPATRSLNDWGNDPPDVSEDTDPGSSSMGSNLSGWYRSLTSREKTKLPATEVSEGSKGLKISRQASLKIKERRSKNNWFIMRALQSEESPSSSSPSPTLADIIARDPPPMPTEGRYKPPVWLEIGPSNKGFEMLQRSGWSEGEALGPDVIRRPIYIPLAQEEMIKLGPERNKKEGGRVDRIKHETVEMKLGGHNDVIELRKVDVIDLTLSDSDSDSEEDDDDPNPGATGTPKVEELIDAEHALHPEPPPRLSSANSRTALLTPIATVLKSDRLGIGLKAKTVGPYKASQKRVTHNAAAMAAHIRAAEESQKRKQLLGRGRRGFVKQQKKEELERKRLLEYFNN